MKVVILCGGQGTRLREYTEATPKPLVDIGSKPILWHVMKIYAHYGFNDFILCLGYKGHLIKEYFINYASWKHQDFTLDFSKGEKEVRLLKDGSEKWTITFVDTGLNTQTGGRLKQIQDLIDNDTFMATYADGIANININELLTFHKKADKIGTLTVIQPDSQFGEINIDNDGLVSHFSEKPRLTTCINGGFFVFHKSFFDYLKDDSVLEKDPLENLAKDRQLVAYRHSKYWKCMDTFKDAIDLNKAWENNQAEWKVW